MVGSGWNLAAGPVSHPKVVPGGSARWKELRAGLVRLDGCSALRAEERAAPGDGPPDGVDDEGKSHFRDLTRCLDRPVRSASSGSGLDFGGHGLPPVTVGAWLPGLASERQPAERAD